MDGSSHLIDRAIRATLHVGPLRAYLVRAYLATVAAA
jgi:hypothetical protein